MIRKTATLTLTLLASAVIAASAQAATPPSLGTTVEGPNPNDNRGITFAGGATTDSGNSFVQTIPFNATAGVVAQISAGTEVGKEADLFLVGNANNNWFMYTPTGWKPWDFAVSTLVPFTTKVLGATEAVTIADLEQQAGGSLDGATIKIHMGLMTDTSPLIYSGPLQFDLASQPVSGSCPTGTSSLPPMTAGGKSMCLIQGTYTQDLHLTSNFEYVIAGGVFIGGDNANSATLTLDAGVKTYGQSGLDFIVINRGSKIMANGTASAPVIMTSANDATATSTTRSQWGGLIINGNAPINGCTTGTLCEANGEGSTGVYGGNNAHDNSGSLKYVQVKYAGFNITPENELNGIAFQGVGDGTVVDYVQVHNSSDDGVEFFGGTVNLKHIVLTGNQDDSLDWTSGWKGKGQFIVIKATDSGDHGFEADNNATNRDALPRSQPKLANITMLGNANVTGGMLLREGTGANLSNVVMQGYGAECIDIDHSATFLAAGGAANTLNGVLTMTNSRINCPTNFREESGDNFTVQAWFEAQAGNSVGDTGMTNYVNSAAINGLSAATQNDSFFEQTSYIGAVKDAASDWTLGWTFREAL
jgi:hypothetical protein